MIVEWERQLGIHDDDELRRDVSDLRAHRNSIAPIMDEGQKFGSAGNAKRKTWLGPVYYSEHSGASAAEIGE